MSRPITLQTDIRLLQKIIRKTLKLIDACLGHEGAPDKILGKTPLVVALVELTELLLKLDSVASAKQAADAPVASELVSDSDRELMEAFVARAKNLKDKQ